MAPPAERPAKIGHFDFGFRLKSLRMICGGKSMAFCERGGGPMS